MDKEVFKQKAREQKIKNPFTEEQLKILWNAKDFVPFADMILYACYSGWRPSELISLKIEKVNLEDNYIRGGIKTDAGKNSIWY